MNKTVELLGDKAEYLLAHTCKVINCLQEHLVAVLESTNVVYSCFYGS